MLSCQVVLGSAFSGSSTFLDVSGWKIFVFCAYISEAMLATRLSLLYLHSISKLTVPYLQLPLTQLFKIAIREKEDHVLLFLVILAPVICFPPNVIFLSNFTNIHLLVLDLLTVLECFIIILYPTISILLKSPRGQNQVTNLLVVSPYLIAICTVFAFSFPL